MGTMSSLSIETTTPEETVAFAQVMGASLGSGAVVALTGELGAGKTHFCKGLALGWGVQDVSQVVSPTYALMHDYTCTRGTFIHMDFYRLDDEDTVRSLGLEEALHRDDAMVAVEWADRLRELIPSHAVWVDLRMLPEGGRRLVIDGLPAVE